MALSLVTAPTSEPVSLEDAKLHLRVTEDDEQDVIQALVTSSREWLEGATGRALPTQTWDWRFDAFPCDGSDILVPKPPLQSVTYVKYYDTTGTLQTWSSANYTVEAPAGTYCVSGRISRNYNVDYPETRAIPNAVLVRFVCGYGESVPESLKGVLKMHLGTQFGPGREALMAVGHNAAYLPTFDGLLWPFKVFG